MIWRTRGTASLPSWGGCKGLADLAPYSLRSPGFWLLAPSARSISIAIPTVLVLGGGAVLKH
jgi:hypothetical protein